MGNNWAALGGFAAFISLFYAAGFGMLGYSLLSIKRSLEASTWPSVVGTVDSCELASNSGGDGSTYRVKVVYRYRVAGRELTNDKLAFGYAGSNGRDAHQEIFEKLENAKTVEVRYDPTDPQRSVLSFGIHRSIQFTLAFAVTWLLFVIGFTILFWIGMRNDSVLLRNLITH